MRDQAVAAVVLSQEVLHGHAMVIARGSEEIGPTMQLEAIKLPGRLSQRKRGFLPTLRCACRAGEGCGLVPGLLVRA